jgi:hypothetical protein
MLIPVQVTAELFPAAAEHPPERVDADVAALNHELAVFFSGAGAEAVGIPRSGTGNVTRTETRAGVDGFDVVAVTLVLALRDITAAAAASLVEKFSSRRFPTAVLLPISDARLERMRGLRAFGDVAAVAHDTAAARISGVAAEESPST